MHACIHTYIHTYAYTYLHIYTYTAQMCIYIYMAACPQAHLHAPAGALGRLALPRPPMIDYYCYY